jgi:CheY-like chemotaxis protein
MKISPVVEESIRDSCGDGLLRRSSNPRIVPQIVPSHLKSSPIIPPEVSKKSENLEILVVEDNLINQKVLKKQLLSRGCSVYVANHGEEALAFLKRTTFWKDVPGSVKLSVILMDLEMPVMDGLTCVRKIRSLEVEGKIRAHIPVIAVTANARGDQIKKAMENGMVGSAQNKN